MGVCPIESIEIRIICRREKACREFGSLQVVEVGLDVDEHFLEYQRYALKLLQVRPVRVTSQLSEAPVVSWSQQGALKLATLSSYFGSRYVQPINDPYHLILILITIMVYY